MNRRFRTLAIAGAVGASACAASVAFAQDTGAAAHRYHVSDVIVGSMLPQEIMTAAVPFDSVYGQLDAAQKAVLFQDYENLPAGDEPPFPLYGVHHLVQPLVRFADTWNPVGPLVASVQVDALGNAVAVTVYKSPDPQLTRLAGGALALEKYKPASCHGEPCAMQYVLRLDFPDRRAQPVQSAAFHRFDQASGDFTRR